MKSNGQQSRDALAIVHAAYLYFCSRAPRDIVRTLFPDAAEDYLSEWVGTYQAGFSSFWSRLDKNHRLLFVEQALIEYGVEGQEFANR